MPAIALPQQWVAPVVARHAAAAASRAAGAIELVIRRAVAHRIVNGDLIAGVDRLHGDDGDLPGKTRIRIARVVDVVRRLVSRERGEVKPLLHLHGVTADVGGQIVELLGGYDASAPHSNDLAGLDEFSSNHGLATRHVTISDFTFIGEVSRRILAHETSASARRAVRFAVYSWRCRPLPVRHPRARFLDAGRIV